MSTTPQRRDGYAPIRDYAVVGDKSTAALIALDGSVDWLSPTGFDAPPVFGALLDAVSGGRFELAPVEPYSVERRYRRHTNVLETTYVTDRGVVRVTDAMAMPLVRSMTFTELIRRIDGVAGEVPMRWRVAPRFGYGGGCGKLFVSNGVPIIESGRVVLAVQVHDESKPEVRDDAVEGEIVAREGDVSVLALSCFANGPLALSSREQLLDRLESSSEQWERLAGLCTYDGPWRDAVVRSVLALDLLVDARTSAIVAAPTMGLPEKVGGSRNYDYRYAWLRDGNLTLEAMLRMGYREQVHASLVWMMSATRVTHPQLRPIYRVDGRPRLPDEQLDLPGYRGSQPVTLGNPAQSQLQLGNFGDVLDMVWHYVDDGNALDSETATRVAELADFVCEIWRRRDSGLWELGERRHYTQSKLACWTALHRAEQLAERELIPARSIGRWRSEQQEIRSFVEQRCWSAKLNAYTQAADGDKLDAAVLLSSRAAFVKDQPERLSATVDAIVRELGAGDQLVYRYSGMRDEENAFLACSFWIAEALARVGRVEEAAEAMDGLVALANDVGLYSEEMEPGTLEFRGNMPQALTHLALVNAADVIHQAASKADEREAVKA